MAGEVFGGNEHGERLATVEAKMEALCTRFERFAEKIEEKFDELLKTSLDRPHCSQRKINCELRMMQIEERLTSRIVELDTKIELRVSESLARHNEISKHLGAVQSETFPKTTVILFSFLTFIIGSLITIITSYTF